ncbi:MAG: insulinase family protein, partial [Oscillospiraceae bacterium]|nr:insulinase family protein [Oscillospiraceae bacterium]
ALDNKGIPHVFEHICASGSESYNSPKLFLSAMSQTFNTYMNASTYDAVTNYEYSTMSEAQLLLMADYYLDSVFYPLLYKDEMTFLRESWRYELTDANAPLVVNGTVYNEMKGAITLERAARHNMMNTLYPGSVAANESGGIPKDILTMTYEDCVNFHRTYYHPSNVLIFLYGDLDIGPFLKLIGSYCDKFGRKDIRADKNEDQTQPFTNPVNAVFEYPMETNSEVPNNSVIYYAFDLGKMSSLEYASFEILATVLRNDSSPIKRKLREALPDANTYVDFSPTAAGCYMAISARGANESDKDTLKKAVDEAIAEIMNVGFDKEHLEAAIASEEFYALSMPENSRLGLRITSMMAWLNSLGLGYDNWNEYINAIEIAKARYTSGYFEEMVGKRIVNNPHNALVVTVPAPGLKEKLDEQLRTELDAVKAGMSDEEIRQIIDMNKELAVMAEAPLAPPLIDRLTAVTVETLPLEIKSYDIKETSLYDVKAYIAKAATGGLNLTCMDYNSAAVTVEELHYLYLYACLLGEVPTVNHDLTNLQIKMARYLYKFSATAGSREFYDYSYKPIFGVQWYSVNGDYTEAAMLVREMLLNTDLSDINTISGVIARLKSSTRNSINNRPEELVYTRARANRFARFAYNDYMRGVAYYQFLSDVQKLLENDPESFTARIQTVRDKIMLKDGAVVMFAGNAEGIDVFGENANTLLGYLSDEPVTAASLSSIPRPAESEGLIVETSVQYNVAFATYDEIGLKYSGKLLPIMEILSDAYLTPTIRYTLGAYSCWALSSRHGLGFISYRDPSITETFAAYDGMADFAAGHDLSQEDINRYIISAFSQQIIPEGELNGALNAMLNKYQGYPDDYKLSILNEIKTVTVNDITNFSKYLAMAMEKGVRSTAGGQAVILENAGLYKSIVYALGAPQD